MSLESGTYNIRCKVNEKGSVGRHIVEDKSFRPKKIFLLEPDIPASEWTLEKKSGNEFIMKNRGAPTANIDGALFGLLINDEEPTVWEIKPQPHLGDNVYLITVANNAALGWVAPSGEETEDPQIEVKPLIVRPSFPPQFPDTELFIITSAEE